MARQIAWWGDEPSERYWLESTDRQDVGADLRAPELDESGRPNWRYLLFKRARPGDIVFHYHKPREAIIAVSRVAGPWRPQEIIWGARGTFARAKGVKPHPRPGYMVPLADYVQLAAPLSLDILREKKDELRGLLKQASESYGGQPLYFPFELQDRPVRPLQGYAFKLPQAFVLAFPELQQPAVLDPIETGSAGLSVPTVSGQSYGVSAEARRVIELKAMDAATEYFMQRGYKVDDVSKTMPYDLVVHNATESLTVEVKGTTNGADAVFLTRNEVEHTRRAGETAVLFVYHGMELKLIEGLLQATGGQAQVHWPWSIDPDDLQPLQFRYTLPAL